jgi:hypothetical protein
MVLAIERHRKSGSYMNHVGSNRNIMIMIHLLWDLAVYSSKCRKRLYAHESKTCPLQALY